jgi:hypothetical protein
MSYAPPAPNLTVTNAFRIDPDPTPPSITSVSPTESNNGRYLYLDIYTDNTHYNDSTIWSPTWYWEEILIRLTNYPDTIFPVYQTFVNPEVLSPTHIRAKFLLPYNSPVGTLDLHVGSWRDGTLVLANAITIHQDPVQAHLLSCTPDSIVQGGSVTLTIQGTGTDFIDGYAYPPEVALRKSDDPEISTGAAFYNIPYSSTALDDSTISFSFSLKYLLPPGRYNIETHNPANGTLTLTEGLTILESAATPYIVSVNPDTLHGKDSAGNINWVEPVTIYSRNTHFGLSYYWPYLFLANHYELTYPNHDYQFVNDTTVRFQVDPYRWGTGTYNLYIGDSIENLVYYHAVYFDNPTNGIKEPVSKNFRLTPNPTSGKVSLVSENTLNKPAELTILSLAGQILETNKISAGTTQMALDLSGKPKGIYLVKLTSAEVSTTQKLILQ